MIQFQRASSRRQKCANKKAYVDENECMLDEANASRTNKKQNKNRRKAHPFEVNNLFTQIFPFYTGKDAEAN